MYRQVQCTDCVLKFKIHKCSLVDLTTDLVNLNKYAERERASVCEKERDREKKKMNEKVKEKADESEEMSKRNIYINLLLLLLLLYYECCCLILL